MLRQRGLSGTLCGPLVGAARSKIQSAPTRGSWIVDLPGFPRDPSMRGSWIVDLPGIPRDPSTRGLWIVDLPVPSEDGPKTHGMRLKLVIFSRSLRSRLYIFYVGSYLKGTA